MKIGSFLSIKRREQKQKYLGFTIVELLVVIVVIAILAAITIVSYTGITQKANATSLQSDLDNASKQLKLYYVDHGSYPTSFNSSWCPLGSDPSPDTRYCLKWSPSTIVSPSDYTSDGSNFSLFATTNNESTGYYISNNSGVGPISTPTLTSPTVTSITSSGATLGANLNSNGGGTIKELGTCWGTSANPITNCSSMALGSLNPLSPSSVAAGSYPSTIAISSDGTSLYVVNGGSNNVSMYSRNTSTGLLTSIGTIAAGGSYASDIAISTDGSSVYVSNYQGNTLSMYSRSTSSGLLTSLGTIATGSNPGGVTISADGSAVYVPNADAHTISMYSRNTSTGLLTSLGTIATGTFPMGSSISADGKSVYVTNQDSTNISMYSRNTSTGLLTSLGTVAAGGDVPTDIVISSDGNSVYTSNQYQTGSGTTSIFSRNTSSGLLTFMSAITAGTYTYYIDISADGKSVYTGNCDSDDIYMYSRNTSNGALSTMSPSTIPAGNCPGGITVSPDDKYVYVANMYGGTILMYSRTNSFSTGAFTQARTGMSSGTLIYYRGYATNNIGVTGYSADGTFTTD